MIKLTYLITKRPDLTDEAFETFWRSAHAKLVESLAETLKAKRYVMSRRIDSVCSVCVSKARELDTAGYDGVIEIWWDSLEDYQEGAGSPQGLIALDAIVDTERRFIDFSRSSSFFVEEQEVFNRTGKPRVTRKRHSKEKLSNETRRDPLIN